MMVKKTTTLATRDDALTAQLETARKAMAVAVTIPEAGTLHSQAAAIETHARQHGLSDSWVVVSSVMASPWDLLRPPHSALADLGGDLAHLDVRGLQIPMDHAGLVRSFQRLSDLLAAVLSDSRSRVLSPWPAR